MNQTSAFLFGTGAEVGNDGDLENSVQVDMWWRVDLETKHLIKEVLVFISNEPNGKCQSSICIGLLCLSFR